MAVSSRRISHRKLVDTVPSASYIWEDWPLAQMGPPPLIDAAKFLLLVGRKDARNHILFVMAKRNPSLESPAPCNSHPRAPTTRCRAATWGAVEYPPRSCTFRSSATIRQSNYASRATKLPARVPKQRPGPSTRFARALHARRRDPIPRTYKQKSRPNPWVAAAGRSRIFSKRERCS